MAKKQKIRNPQDSTMRNTQSANKKFAAINTKIAALEVKINYLVAWMSQLKRDA